MSFTVEIQKRDLNAESSLYLVFRLVKRPTMILEFYKKFGPEPTYLLIQNFKQIEKRPSELWERLGKRLLNKSSFSSVFELNCGLEKDQNCFLESDKNSDQIQPIYWSKSSNRSKKDRLSPEKGLARDYSTISLFWDQNLFKSVYKLMWTFELAGA